MNTERILDVVEGPSGAHLRNAIKRDATLGELVSIFERDIERPQHPTGRQGEAAQLYPHLANLRASQIDAATPVVGALTKGSTFVLRTGRKLGVWGWVGLAVAVFAGSFLLFWGRR